MENRIRGIRSFSLFLLCVLAPALFAQDAAQTVQLPNGKLLGMFRAAPRQINNLPTAIAISPDGAICCAAAQRVMGLTVRERSSLFRY